MAKFTKDNSDSTDETITGQNSVDITSSDYFPPPEDRMKQKEVAAMFDRTVQTIINWAKAGKIPYYQIGHKPVYSKKQLIKYASKNQSLINQRN